MDENPYNAGFGAQPPLFAGRKDEINLIDRALNVIQGKAGPMGRSPIPAIALVGPRGVGKTVLLGRAVEEATRRKIHVGKASRDLLSGPQDKIVSQLFPQSEVEKAVGKVKDIGGSLAGAGVSLGFHEAQEESLRPAMLAFLAKNPLLLFLDETHHCEPEGLSLLFDIAQECILSKLPLAFIYAGTPGLESHLRRCKMTYVERSKFLYFNTLSRDEARDALEVPAREAGRPMESAALNCLLDWSDNYPYFIQMAGEHAWDVAMGRGASAITLEDANNGLTKADKLRRKFYGGRYKELDKRKVVTHALQVIDLIDGRPDKQISYRKLIDGIKDANDGMGHDRAVGIYEVLVDLGFIFENDDKFEAGIPSLFDYVKKQEDA